MALGKRLGTAACLAVAIFTGMAVESEWVRAQTDIAFDELTREECAKMCSGLVNPIGCRHAYYVTTTRRCHLTDDDERDLNFRPGIEIWSLNRNAWLRPEDTAAGLAGDFELGVDRPGGDIKPGFDIASPTECRAACSSTLGCKAFTYVQPGVQAGSARCWLKDRVPAPVSRGCCISGVMRASSQQAGLHPCADPGAVISRRIEICGFAGCATYGQKSNFVCKEGGYFLIDSLNVVPVKCNADYSDCSPEDYVLAGQTTKVDAKGRTWIEGYERNTKTGQSGAHFSFSEVP